jgi:hypothetical protein
MGMCRPIPQAIGSKIAKIDSILDYFERAFAVLMKKKIDKVEADVKLCVKKKTKLPE